LVALKPEFYGFFAAENEFFYATQTAQAWQQRKLESSFSPLKINFSI
jgi:hypothetical protein